VRKFCLLNLDLSSENKFCALNSYLTAIFFIGYTNFVGKMAQALARGLIQSGLFQFL
jgi:hypothetical protein